MKALVVVILILLIAAGVIALFSPSQPYIASGIANVRINITPTQLPASSPDTFNISVNAVGYSDTPNPLSWRIEVYDQDPAFIPNDKLATKNFTITGTSSTPGVSGITPVLSTSTPIHTWQKNATFTLSCDGTTVIGPAGSSGEQEAEIFVRFILIPGPGIEVKQDSVVQVIKCIDAEAEEEASH